MLSCLIQTLDGFTALVVIGLEKKLKCTLHVQDEIVEKKKKYRRPLTTLELGEMEYILDN